MTTTTTDRLAVLDSTAATMRDIGLRAVAHADDRGQWHRLLAHETVSWCYRHLVARANRLADGEIAPEVVQLVRDAASFIDTFAARPRWTDADIHVAKLALDSRSQS